MGEKKCLITQNLIESVKWYMEAPTTVVKRERGGDGVITWKQRALNDLKNMLGRVPGDFPIEAQNGVNFEKKVYEFANNPSRKGSKEFNEVCDRVAGMNFGRKGGKNVTIGEYECYVYAKYDAILLPVIRDIKTTKSYSKGKYLQSIQHKLYCYISEAKEFEYVIAEWKEYPEIKAVHYEKYDVVDNRLLEKEIHASVINCLDNLQNLGLFELYRDKYCLY